ncbi:MAG TPA: hypothetical protein VHO92_05200 [Methanobacterium sp.]|nr:hypothetical protein [Methanobacterium sp.]
MVTESVKCGRCGEWFQREILEDKKIKRTGKVEEYLCPECDEEIKESE